MGFSCAWLLLKHLKPPFAGGRDFGTPPHCEDTQTDELLGLVGFKLSCAGSSPGIEVSIDGAVREEAL
uniref:Uncharacterized protein n=1 Tax=mine drainage metagenome TaxID=410659 RepID=E6PG02_9ZZZZ